MTVSFETYERVALEDGDEQWELVCGRLRKKPGMTFAHNLAEMQLRRQLDRQLDPEMYAVRENSALLRISNGSFYVPDLCVVPLEYARRALAERPTALEVYEEAVPLVVEVWSPSTGDYDVDAKLREYQLRGDAEIWRLHPTERTLTAWRRHPDGSYSEVHMSQGIVEPVALPGVRIELAALFTL